MAIRHKSLAVIYLDDENIVRFGFNSRSPQTLSGIDLLLQNIVIRLFTSQESNAFEETIGGSLYEIIAGGYTPGDADVLQTDFINAFSFVETQIINEQASQVNLPPTEQLASINLLSVEYNELEKAWEIITKVNTVAGTTATFTIAE